MTESPGPEPLDETGLLSWNDAKRWYFGEDGSLRDIIVPGTTEREWVRLVDWVVDARIPYRYSPFDEADDPILQNATLVDPERPVDVLLHPETLCIRALPFLSGPDRIELDIRPEWVRSRAQYRELVAFLRGMARAIGRAVEVRPENQEPALFVVGPDGSARHVSTYAPEVFPQPEDG